MSDTRPARGREEAVPAGGGEPGDSASNPLFLESGEAFRAWLEANHRTARELWVGMRRVGTGRASIRWPEAVDEALCFGWIDGVRKGLDEDSYVIRFTPRRPTSVWSLANVRRVGELASAGRMRPGGIRAFEARRPDRTGVYSFERERAELTPEMLERLRASTAAWSYWSVQPPGYRRVATHWVVSAKRDGTRLRRFETLLADCEAGRRLAVLTLRPKEMPGG